MACVSTAVLVSGRGSNLQALFDAAKDPAYPAEISVVISNEPDAPAIDLAAANGADVALVPHREQPSRWAFETMLQTHILESGCTLVCLAGFMRILSPAFVAAWPGRLLNIHPSLLPAFPGLDTHRRALEAGVAEAGCSVHFVTDELDGGPIIAQAAVPVLPDDSADSLATRVLQAEHRLYPHCLALVASGAVRLEDGLVVGRPATSDQGFRYPST
ncbi:MAG: phosphoribosylglycinamide formyltransferase [Pseudomonadota bacterium]